MIVIVAPYTGYNVGNEVNLGASKKIRFIISALSKLSNKIILVNSAHNNTIRQKLVVREISIESNEITEIILPVFGNKFLGKFLNLFHTNQVLDLLSKDDKIELIWHYNAYSFEMVFAKKAKKRFQVPMILEFEDWHFARDRRFNPKPLFDYFLWRLSAKIFSRVYVVNSMIKNNIAAFSKDIRLFPGIVPNYLINIKNNFPPFKYNSKHVHIGYFGGLNEEKGADIIMKLSDILPDNFIIHVTGLGVLTNQFKNKALLSQGRLIFHGYLHDVDLYKVIEKCDIILNPHKPINNFKNGIFPFKVIEAIASGRLLISTNLSFSGFEEVSMGTRFVNHSLNEFFDAILGADTFYHRNYKQIIDASNKAVTLFGESSFIDSLREYISHDYNSS